MTKRQEAMSDDELFMLAMRRVSRAKRKEISIRAAAEARAYEVRVRRHLMLQALAELIELEGDQCPG